MENKERINKLVEELNRASQAYYNDKDEIMSNYEWDALFDELSQLEKSTGYILPNSPTQTTGFMDNITSSNREQHEFPALSLAKSKEKAVIQNWAGGRPVWISWKLDGLTLVATYDNGKLSKLMTRGNGTVGNNITYLSDYIKGLPKSVDEKGHLVVRGEATISYKDFDNLNELIENDDERYANPRNLVSGTMALDKSRAKEVEQRKVTFNAFTLVYTDRMIKSWGDRMNFLSNLGFVTVEREFCNSENIPDVIEKWTDKVKSGNMDTPVDGLVITFDDTDYAKTGSVTGHHATNAGIAFKWQDVQAETVLDHIEWSCAASTISPVAVFKSVQLEGTEVKRCSLCNISEMERLGIGADGVTKMTVIKANMIIPKCVAADSCSTEFEIPKKCPVCNAPTEIHIGSATGAKTLHCTNPDCNAKHIKKYQRFVSKSGMDIDGLSIETLVKFINKGFISDFADIYEISNFKDDIIEMDGFGEKSYFNLVNSVEKSKNVNPINFIYSLSIAMIGLDAAKRLVDNLGTDGFFERLYNKSSFDDIDGIGPERSNSILNWYNDTKNQKLLEKLLNVVNIENTKPRTSQQGKCMGKTFVITGDVHHFKNRNEFKTYVEEQGGKVTGSVSNKTDFLVNNDITSTSSKNNKAKSLNIPIITEDEFIKMFK